MAKTFKTTLNSSGESGHSSLLHDFRGNVFNFSALRIMFAVGLSYFFFNSQSRILRDFSGWIHHFYNDKA